MRNLFDYTPPEKPEEKKLRLTVNVPQMATGELTDNFRKMKLTIPDNAKISNIKSQHEVKTDNVDNKANQRVRRGEETTLF